MIDVIIPVYKPDEKFTELLKRLQKQETEYNRLILINTEKAYWRDSCLEHVRNAEVYHITKEEFDHAATRRMGAEISDAEYMLFLTQDAVPADRQLLSNLLAAMQNKNVAVAYARQIADGRAGSIDAYTRAFNYPDADRIKSEEDIKTMGIKAFFCSDVCALYRKADYRMLGGFVERAVFNEDMIFAHKVLKAGKCVAYKADAKVIHSHQYTAMQQFRRNFDLAVSQKEHPEVFAGIKSETEGLRLVKSTAAYLWKKKKPFEMIRLIYLSAAKYAGYKLGWCYDRMPHRMLLFCTSNTSYWH